MATKHISIFKIDFHQAAVETIDHTTLTTDFDEYLTGLIAIMTQGRTGRSFIFERETTEVRGQIKDIIEDKDFATIANTIANRLLNSEQTAQEQMAKMGVEIQRGIIVLAVITDDGADKFIICKADHNEFLEDTKFTKSRGLPIKKKVFKGFICSLNSDQTVSDILVCDSHQTKYWWKDFLELKPVHSNEDNTQNAFDAIDKGVLVKLKKKHPQDYMHLSNSNVRYFRGTVNFDINECLEQVFGNYQPFDPKLKIDKLKSEVRALAKKANAPFDEQFAITKNQIRKRFIKDIPLTAQIELHFKEEVPNLESVVTAEQGADGTKYVKVKSEQGYQYFSNRQTDTN